MVAVILPLKAVYELEEMSEGSGTIERLRKTVQVRLAREVPYSNMLPDAYHCATEAGRILFSDTTLFRPCCRNAPKVPPCNAAKSFKKGKTGPGLFGTCISLQANDKDA